MSTAPTNIRVFVQWAQQTVFTGEDIECHITFKNVAASALSVKALQRSRGNVHVPGGERQKRTAIVATKDKPLVSARQAISRGHRATLSLNGPLDAGRTLPGPESLNGSHETASRTTTHRRSVSIISMGASEAAVEDVRNHHELVDRSSRRSKGHGRSTSLQIVPRRCGAGPSGSLGSGTIVRA